MILSCRKVPFAKWRKRELDSLSTGWNSPKSIADSKYSPELYKYSLELYKSSLEIYSSRLYLYNSSLEFESTPLVGEFARLVGLLGREEAGRSFRAVLVESGLRACAMGLHLSGQLAHGARSWIFSCKDNANGRKRACVSPVCIIFVQDRLRLSHAKGLDGVRLARSLLGHA